MLFRRILRNGRIIVVPQEKTRHFLVEVELVCQHGFAVQVVAGVADGLQCLYLAFLDVGQDGCFNDARTVLLWFRRFWAMRLKPVWMACMENITMPIVVGFRYGCQQVRVAVEPRHTAYRVP